MIIRQGFFFAQKRPFISMDHNYRTKLYTHIHTHNVYTLNFLHQCIYRSFFFLICSSGWSIYWPMVNSLNTRILSNIIIKFKLWNPLGSLEFLFIIGIFFYNNNNNEPINKTKQKKQNEIFGLHLFFFSEISHKFLMWMSEDNQQSKQDEERERERWHAVCFTRSFIFSYVFVCVCISIRFDYLLVFLFIHSLLLNYLVASLFSFFFLMILHHHHQFTVYALHAWPCVCCCCLYLVRFFFFHFFWLSKW